MNPADTIDFARSCILTLLEIITPAMINIANGQSPPLGSMACAVSQFALKTKTTM